MKSINHYHRPCKKRPVIHIFIRIYPFTGRVILSFYMGTDFTNVTLTDHVNIKSEEHGIRVVRIVVVHVTIVGVAEVVRVFRIRRTKPNQHTPPQVQRMTNIIYFKEEYLLQSDFIIATIYLQQSLTNFTQFIHSD